MRNIFTQKINDKNTVAFQSLPTKSPNLNKVSTNIKKEKNYFKTKIVLKKLMETKFESKNMKSEDFSLYNNQLKSYSDEKEFGLSLSIDSKALDFAFSSTDHRKIFCQILFLAKSVCFHSLMPNQVISVIRFLKENFLFKPTVLAIGETGIGILDEVCIGVSIKKNEKVINFNQDIEISKFSEVTKLILVEGHYSCVRLSKVLLYTIYKETMVCTLLFLYQFHCDFSGTSVIDLDLLILFEFVISFVPIVIIGSFEKDVSEESILSSTTLYSTGYLNLDLSNKRIFFYYIIGATQGAIIFVFLEYGYGEIVNSLGFTENNEVKGLLGFILICLSILNKVFLGTSLIYIPTVLSPIITIGFMILGVELVYSNNITKYSLSRELLFSQSSF